LISFAFSYQSSADGGFGYTSMELTAGPLLMILTLLAFALGFRWMYRRSSISH
jgi:hypothetical protein